MVPKLTPDQSILALDVGDARIGLARASAVARLPEPLKALNVTDSVIDDIKNVMIRENIGLLVVGIPRNLKGEETPQSQKIRNFAKNLEKSDTPMVFVDESLSSKRADSYLAGNKNARADQDSIAACFILEEFFTTIGVEV